MKEFLILLLSIALITAETDLESQLFIQFQKFITKYHKKYSSVEEYLSRFAVFRLNYMETLKSESLSYSTGITKFADLTSQEFKKKYLNLDFPAIVFLNQNPVKIKKTNSAPDAWDWREHNAITDVQDQGSCGAAYAFSVICNLESLYGIHKGQAKPFSMQYLIDCDPNNTGCSGGLMESTFKWLIENGGHLMFEADYPYVGYKGSCKADPSKYVDMIVKGFVKLGGGTSTFSPVDEDEMKEYLYNNGALSVALNATPLQTYSGGIIDLDKSKCNPAGINHACAVVGYGTEDGLDYWIVKNSWGSVWGDNGYFRIARGKGTCGINMYVLSATVEFPN